ncbi:hypothetical protein [Agromyces sp. NPDC058064]|uniref:hypothetical protein n=1 Tax=Agromyces sp. NPDC058064 TaxID=3346322 RepID=UPI0036DE8D69
MTRFLIRRPATVVGRCLALSVASLALMTACATPPPSGATAAPTESAAAIVSIEMPELAPYPEPAPPLTEAESEAKRLADADQRWQGVLASFPDAVRPAVEFEGYVTDQNRVDVLRACYEAAGLQIDEGRTAENTDGQPDTISWSGTTEAEWIAAYA